MKITNKNIWKTDFAETERKKFIDDTKSSFLLPICEACGWLLVVGFVLVLAKASFLYMDKADQQAKTIVSQQYVKLYADAEQLMKGHEE